MVEIARALAIDARVLILDEPSATLSALEVDRLFTVLRRLRERGLGIIYISHRLEEIFALADRVTVLRDGRQRDDRGGGGAGADATDSLDGRTRCIRGVSRARRRRRGGRCWRCADCRARRGSMMYRSRFAKARSSASRGSSAPAARLRRSRWPVRSVRPARSGSTAARRGSDRPSEAIGRGVAYVTEDRKARGIFPMMATESNITIAFLRQYAPGFLLRLSRERAAASHKAREFDVARRRACRSRPPRSREATSRRCCSRAIFSSPGAC